MTDLFRPILDQIGKLWERADKMPTVRWGTVTQSSPLLVLLDGDTTTVAPQTLVKTMPPGSRVVCVEQHRRMIVVQAPFTVVRLGGEDLDTVTTPGSYVQQSGSVPSDPALHYPANRAGFLEVLARDDGAVGVLQRYTDYTSGRKWERTRFNGVWGDWQGVWRTLPLLSPYVLYDSTRAPVYRIENGWLNLSGLVKPQTGTMTGSVSIAQLPFTLPRTAVVPVVSDSAVVRLVFNGTGKIDLILPGTTAYCYLDGARVPYFSV